MKVGAAHHSLRTPLLLAISLLTLLVYSFALFQAYHQWQRMNTIHALKQATGTCDLLFDLSEKVSAEREVSFAILNSNDPDAIAQLAPLMAKNRKAVDDGLAAVAPEIGQYHFDDLHDRLQGYDLSLQDFKAQRGRIDAAIAHPLAPDDAAALATNWFDVSTALVYNVQDVWMALIRHYIDIDPTAVLHMRLKHMLGIIMEYTGRERSLISGMIAGNRPGTPDEQANLLRWQGMADLAWKLSSTLANLTGLDTPIAPYLKEARSHYTNGYNMVRQVFYIPGAQLPPPYPISIGFWIELSQEQIDSLYDLKAAVLTETKTHIDLIIDAARYQIILQLFVAGAAILICGFIFFFVDRSVIRPISRIVDRLHLAVTGKPVPAEDVLAGSHFREMDTLVRVLGSFQEKSEETRRAGIAIARHAARLERSNAELDQFAYVASHDLKAPLRGIDNLAMWIEEDAGDALPELAREHVKMLRGRVSRLEDLLSGILSYSRAGRIVENLSETDTATLARSVADMWVSDKFTVTIGRLPVMLTPRTAFEQILGNLLSNAAKHHDKNEGHIDVSAMDMDEFWQFEISDDGPGIPDAYREKVFEMFTTLKPRDVVEGSGLGMAIAKKLVLAVGGRIWVKPQAEARGTTICFLWPKTLRDL